MDMECKLLKIRKRVERLSPVIVEGLTEALNDRRNLI